MPTPIRQRITRNWKLKALALILASGLWFVVARDPVSVVAVEVPIEFNNIPQNLELTTETVPRIQIRLRGPEHIILRLQPSDVYAELDLDAQKPGDRTFDITARQVHEPSGLEVVQVVPSQVRVSFDTRVTRAVEVKPRVIGNFAQGYSLHKIVSVPPTIYVTGPQKQVAAVDSAITDPIDVSGVVDHIVVRRHAYVPDPLIQVVDPQPVEVTVYVARDSSPDGGH